MLPLAQIISGQVTRAAAAGPSLQPGLMPIQSNSKVIVPGALFNLTNGTELIARVDARLQPGLFLLTINGQKIAARSDLALTTGEKLAVILDKTGPSLVLKITLPQRAIGSSNSVTGTTRNLEQRVINQALRGLLPRQRPISALLIQVNQLPAKQISGRLPALLPPLLTQPNDPRQLLQPQKLIRALTNSGVLLENKLLTTPGQTLEADIKTNLLRALQQAPTNPLVGTGDDRMQKQLREITDSALARIQTQQLATVRDETGRRVLTTDLILRDAERTSAVEVAIDRPSPPPEERPGSDPDQHGLTPPMEHRWRVTLNFDLPGIGKLQSLIRLDSGTVQVDFRSDHAPIREQLTSRFKQLTDRLASAGMADSQLTAGILSNKAANHKHPPTGQLINLLS